MIWEASSNLDDPVSVAEQYRTEDKFARWQLRSCGRASHSTQEVTGPTPSSTVTAHTSILDSQSSVVINISLASCLILRIGLELRMT